MHLLYGSEVIVHGDFLSESSWSLAFQTMQLLIVLQLVVILYKGTASVSMGLGEVAKVTRGEFIVDAITHFNV